MDHGTRSNRMTQRTALNLIQRGDSFVYALLTNGGAVKIGVTTNLARRKSAIAFGGFDRFLAFVPGTFDDEQAIHASMPADLRLPGRREYYYPLHEHVLPAVNEMRDAMALPRLDRADLPRTGYWCARLPRAEQPVSWPWPKPWAA